MNSSNFFNRGQLLGDQVQTADTDYMSERYNKFYRERLPRTPEGIFFSTEPDNYQSVFAKGQRFEDSPEAEAKATAQEIMWEDVQNRINIDAKAGLTTKQMMYNQQVWYKNVPAVRELFYNLDLDPLNLSEHDEYKFFKRTGIWLNKLAKFYISEKYNHITKSRAEHVDKAPMKDVIVDGVLWNPVQFRRFLPYQFINKTLVWHRGDIGGSLFDFVNSSINVQRYTNIFDGMASYITRCSNSYVTPWDVEDKGYADDANLLKEFGDMQIVKSAILYHERAVLLRDIIDGKERPGALNKISERVKSMSRDDVNEYLTAMIAYYSECGIDWFTDSNYSLLKTFLF